MSRRRPYTCTFRIDDAESDILEWMMKAKKLTASEVVREALQREWDRCGGAERARRTMVGNAHARRG